jgi:uncharacterized protein
VATNLEDERTQPPKASVPHVDVQPPLALVREQPDARLVLLNWYRAVKPGLAKQLAAAGVCFGIATMENVGGVANLLDEISAERSLFGSHAPFCYFESTWLKLKKSALDTEKSRAVRELNARRLLV